MARGGKKAKRQANLKQRLRDQAAAKRAKGPPLPPSPPLSALPRGALDLSTALLFAGLGASAEDAGAPAEQELRSASSRSEEVRER